ncbi:patatin-like phospholipase family protein [Archangium gephyra]|uniref:hypothetical protein n=1 Tax=Archangium gephyra TaxID=48 RepID=UPI0035D47963
MNPSTETFPDPRSINATYQEGPGKEHDLKECDLIMKGGVTSGVVYPPAILDLARRYRFRSVGGTSAGAIAAAAAAAAEYGRERAPESTSTGFAGLYGMMEELQREGFLFNLFQPAPEARPLFDTLLHAMELFGKSGTGHRGRHLLGLLQELLEEPDAPKPRKHLPFVTPEGSAALLAWPALSLVRSVSRPVKALAASSTLWSIGKLVQGLLGSWNKLKGGFSYVMDRERSFFALCTGMPPEATLDGNKGAPALTPWLHERLQQLAGLAPHQVLTIGMLRGKKHPLTGNNAGIDFQMVTTNLSQRQPYTLHGESPEEVAFKPPRPEELEAGYLFKESDMRKLFPDEIVEYLKTWTDPKLHPEYAEQWKRDKAFFEGFALPEGYFHFPRGNALPVVVATRMSLSFPLLLSAVRLYTLKYDTLHDKRGTAQAPYTPRTGQAQEDNDLRENWFSDGGIASNFPIHIFDAWLPSRPTFGINLADSQLPTTLTGPRESPIHRREEDVFLPQPRDIVPPQVYPIHQVSSFLGAIFDTAQNYRDNTQARMPSYRERVVQVRLQDDEGGLNLKMSPDTIKRVADKGREAARALEQFDFNEHRWVRLLVLLAKLEREFIRLRERYEQDALARAAKGEGTDHDGWKGEMARQYEWILNKQLDQHAKGHDWYRSKGEEWNAQALERMKALIELISSWTATEEAQRSGPRKSATGEQPTDEDVLKYIFAYDAPIPEGILRVTPEN